MPVALPVLPADARLPLTPTDVTQFVRFDQCERFLRLRLAARAGQDFMREYGVTPQFITPLLSRFYGTFERDIEDGDAAAEFAADARWRLAGEMWTPDGLAERTRIEAIRDPGVEREVVTGFPSPGM